ncbi:dual specificity calcium/calmodulin-dependent 3',5'-cyclic nucleotide phosphodiesterase 1A isoform X4 [Patella vulgata]|uniref:dual specificity calcium/calmodulin-dependent 3',5'-cyclic nucleotide phosphodiesterase 1A isoform X4 n=1 Tax=Patella vulgata TaxID=6465 RepID=UPI00217F89FC|nr:dual specificity calcium/calmodulin-dependent 3',5'-cyclic nucleotide phosphodiesterase 1A isoform X4 [Patella vulgata]
MAGVSKPMELKPYKDRPRIYMSSRTHKVVVLFPNGELVEVANPPEKSKDDSSVASRNGQLSRTGSLTVLRRSNSRKTGSSSSRASSISMDSADSYASVDLSTDKLPPVDSPEASHICSLRLRHLIRRLEKDEVSKEDLKKNLEYASSVLETIYIDETRLNQHSGNNKRKVKCKKDGTKERRLCDEDDELSEVEPDAVPSEVRDWLALTFTRSMSNLKRKGEEKPRFRSVAHAIRAGIMVDRIYRRMSSSLGMHVPPHILILLKSLDDWSFNVFTVNDASDGHALKFVGYELLQKYDLITKFKISSTVLDSFLVTLEQGYSKYKNPYHNALHGADVAQTVHHLLSQSKLAQWLTDLEVFATIIAALIHDYEHTGTTNNFHVNTGSDVALLYNDRAVLENHHISAAFRLMKDEDLNVAHNLSKEEYREFRTLVIDMVLATDMSFHFQQIKNMKNLLSMPENIEKSKALSLVLHCADISHPAKDWDLHKKWTDFLLEEFFLQGDREQELGLPFSPLCDRKNTLVAQSQIGFIDFIVDPSLQVLGDMLEKVLNPHNQPSNSVDQSISEEVFEREKKTSVQSNRSSSRSSLSSLSGRFELRRPWVKCLIENKEKWKEKSLTDGEQRAAISTEKGTPSDGDESRRESSSSTATPVCDKPEAGNCQTVPNSIKTESVASMQIKKVTNCEVTSTSPSSPPVVPLKPKFMKK